LAGERVIYVGEAVVMVVAETLGQALDAADLVRVDYEETAAVIDPREAEKPGAPQIHPDAPGNVAIDWPGMVESADNEREVDDIIKAAPHVARVSVHHQRIAVMSMETRGANARYDTKTDSYDLRACSQSATTVRNQTAPVLNIEPSKLRVVTEDVGGGQNTEHALGLGRFAGYDRYDAGMGVRRAHEHREGLIGIPRIVNKAAEAAGQRVVFEPAFSLAMIDRRIHACSPCLKLSSSYNR
jgi:hypothetical protein